MNPFFFGDSKQQLFGAYLSSNGRSSRGAVLCYPWAREYLLAHPAMRLLSQRLADSGWHSLRFDYLGTGDSAGDFTDMSQPQWLSDVATAVDELKEIAQLKEIALIGMRHGATLAALAAARRHDISKLVLWDPVADGKQYLEELGVSPRGMAISEADVQGAVLTNRLRSELEVITPTSFGDGLPQTLVVSTSPKPGAVEALEAHLRSAGVDYAVEHVPDVQVWREEWGRGGKGLAVDAVSRIITWLD